MAKITINEIARKTNLSIATISRAINPQTKHLVRVNTRSRINAVIKNMGYTPSVSARRLATGKSYNIVIFFKSDFRSIFYNDYYSKMLAGAMRAIELSNYHLIVSLIKDENGPFDLESSVRRLDVAGAILCNIMGAFKLSVKNIANNMDVPVLIINQYKREENPNCFLIDNFRSGYEAVSYLIKRGHRRIAFVHGIPAVKDGQDRFLGYRRALEDNRIRFAKELVYHGDFSSSAGEAAVRHFFKGKMVPPRAVFFANDTMAIGALNELIRLGIKCPDEVSVMGFDGIDAGRFTYPPLTTVCQPIQEMAKEAVREMIYMIENRTTFEGTRHFRAHILERGSVAALV
jgi:LacI family transcriptional regulator